VTLTLRKTGDQARIEGLNADIWAEHGYAVVEPDINKRVGRIYPDMIRSDLRWPCWFLEEKKIRWLAEADRPHHRPPVRRSPADRAKFPEPSMSGALRHCVNCRHTGRDLTGVR
jgi:hypothetical protein